MKHFLKITLAALFLLVGTSQVKAQKIAHCNLDSLMKIMPDVKHAEDSLRNYLTNAQSILLKMKAEYDAKVQDYLEKKDKQSPLINSLNEKQISDLEENMSAYQQSAQEEYGALRVKLYKPIYDKIDKAAQDIAKAKGYKYVIDSSKSNLMVLYADPADDIFADMMLKLNIPKPTVAPAGGAAPGNK